MAAEPSVSVIVAAYNEERYLSSTVVCLLSQTHKNLEVIVVDDGSTDRTPTVLEEMADSRLRVVRQDNAGSYVARNRGITEAHGDYIVFHDADDLMPPHRIKQQVDFLKANPNVHGVGTQVAVFTDGMRRAVQLWRYPTDPEMLAARLHGRFAGRPFICFGSFMFRADVLKEREPFYPEDVRNTGDWIAFRRYASELRYANLDTVGYFFRVSGDTASLRKNLLQSRYMRYYDWKERTGDTQLSFDAFLGKKQFLPWRARIQWDLRVVWGWAKFKGRILQVRALGAMGRGVAISEAGSD